MTELTIFLKNGTTLQFEDVSMVDEDEDTGELCFIYMSASKGIPKTAFFRTGTIAGYSVSLAEVDG